MTVLDVKDASGGRSLFINAGDAASAVGVSIPILPQTSYVRLLFINDAGAASAGGVSIPILLQTSYVTPAGYNPPGFVTIFGTNACDAYSARRA